MPPTFAPREKPERTTDKATRRAHLTRIRALFSPYRARLSTVLGLIFLSAGLGMLTPFLLREVLDEAIPNQDTTLLTWLVAGMIGVAVATGALSVVQTYLSNTVGQSVMHDLRTRVYAHLQKL
jgi:ATP-binding cassette, subfamily B, bacterial